MEKPITVSVDASKVVNIAIIGDLLEDKLDGLIASREEGVKIIADMYYADNKRVKVIIDLSSFTGKYAMKCFMEMLKFANSTKDYVEKTAVFGGSYQGKMIVEIIGAIALHENVKFFETKEEAMEWLSKNHF